MDLTVSLEDESGINIMETIGHGIRYAFDDNNEVLVPGNDFIYTNCSGGFVNIPIPLSISEGTHQLSLEAWDGLNNKTDTLIYLELLSPIDENKLHLSKVYPVPSPFSTNTHFTMITTHFPVKIIINIYSINGIQVQTLSPPIIEEANGGFVSIGWDGRDKYGNKIANGVYFYHVKAETNNNLVFEEIYKLSKIE